MKNIIFIAALTAWATCAPAASAQTVNEVMARMQRLASGEYAREVEAERARTPPVNWGPTRIQTAARQSVLSELRDPSSAQFRNVRRIQHANGTTMFCGEVNARNGYGGMAGFKRFEAGVTNRGEASTMLDDQEGLTGAYFRDAWAQFCGRLPGTPVQF